MKNHLLLLFLLFLLVSCTSAKPKFIAIDNWVFGDLKDSILNARVDYLIFNPNKTTYKLTASEVAMYYKQLPLGKGSLEKEIRLNPMDTIRLPMHCEINLEKLSRFQEELFQADSALFQIKGVSRIAFLGSTFSIQMDETITLNTKRLLSEKLLKRDELTKNFKVEGLMVSNLPALNKTSFSMKIATRNTLLFDYEIQKIALDFYVDVEKEAISQWTSEETIHLKKEQAISIPMEVTVNNFSMIQQTRLSWFTRGKAALTAKGEITVLIGSYAFNIPVEQEMTFDLNPFKY